MQTKTWRLEMDFYEMLGERDLNQRNMAMTVLEGEYLVKKHCLQMINQCGLLKKGIFSDTYAGV